MCKYNVNVCVQDKNSVDVVMRAHTYYIIYIFEITLVLDLFSWFGQNSSAMEIYQH